MLPAILLPKVYMITGRSCQHLALNCRDLSKLLKRMYCFSLQVNQCTCNVALAIDVNTGAVTMAVGFDKAWLLSV